MTGPGSARAIREGRNVEAVVADVVLGEGKLSGIELIAALRKQEVRAPVVLVTAFADTQRLKAALNAGASYLILFLSPAYDHLAAERPSGETRRDPGTGRMGTAARSRNAKK